MSTTTTIPQLESHNRTLNLDSVQFVGIPNEQHREDKLSANVIGLATSSLATVAGSFYSTSRLLNWG